MPRLTLQTRIRLSIDPEAHTKLGWRCFGCLSYHGQCRLFALQLVEVLAARPQHYTLNTNNENQSTHQFTSDTSKRGVGAASVVLDGGIPNSHIELWRAALCCCVSLSL